MLLLLLHPWRLLRSGKLLRLLQQLLRVLLLLL
jgi:hypothetical protein